jgi:hypothetical protein
VIGAPSLYPDLVFHFFAFVPLSQTATPRARAASLYWPRWVDFARRRLAGDALVVVERDAALLAELVARDDDLAATIQILALLHDDADAAARSSLLDVAAIPDTDCRPAIRSVLAKLPPTPVEVARLAIALASDDFAGAHREILAPFAAGITHELTPRLCEVAAWLGALGRFELRLSTTLGPRGRAIGSTIFVGTSSVPGDEILDLDAPVVLALHEVAVATAAAVLGAHQRASGWEAVEALALAAEERLVAGKALEPAHRSWRESLDVSGIETTSDEALVQEVVARLGET